MDWNTIKKAISDGDYYNTHPAFTETTKNLIEVVEHLSLVLPEFKMEDQAFTAEVVRTKDQIDWNQIIGRNLPYWKAISRMLRSIESVQGFDRFIRQFKSHSGMERQLLATLYIQQFFPLVGIEQVREGQDIDIIASVNGEEVFFHVKTVDQIQKRQVQSEIDHQLFDLLWKRPFINELNQRINLVHLIGAFPSTLTDSELEEIHARLPDQLVQKISRTEVVKGKPVLHELNLTFGWAVGTGSIGGIDLMRNLEDHYDKVNDSIPQNSMVKNFLLGVTVGAESCEVNVDRLENGRLDGIFFISTPRLTCGFHFERSSIFVKYSVKEFGDFVEANLSATFDLTF